MLDNRAKFRQHAEYMAGRRAGAADRKAGTLLEGNREWSVNFRRGYSDGARGPKTKYRPLV